MTKADLAKRYSQIENYKDYSDLALARLIIADHKELFSKKDESGMRKAVYIARKKKEPLVVEAKEETKWSVTDNYYTWKSSKGEIKLSVAFIDQLFFEYSEHGLNLSQTKIRNKHNLEPWQWHSIKNTLLLYKASHVFSPYTVEITPAEELEEMVKEKVGKVFSSVAYQVEDQYNKQLRQEYKKVIRKQAQKDLVHETIITELQDFIQYLPKLKIVPTSLVNVTSNDKVINVFIFDVHFGAENRSRDLPEYSPEITEQLFDQIAEEVNSFNAKEVNVFFGGDNIETFTGLNHPDSWKGIAQGYYGAEVVKRAYKVYVKFLNKIANVKKVYAVPGNHDRATEGAAVDAEGYIADILFEFIRLSFADAIEVEYNKDIISAAIDGINYLMSHGHKKLTDINAAELIIEYGDPSLFNILMSGHYHSRKVKKDHKRFRQYVCSSIFPGNNYSKGLGVSSLPGFTIVENRNGKPKVHDYSL